VPDGKEADREAGHHPRSQADINRQRNASQQRQAALVEEIQRAGAMMTSISHWGMFRVDCDFWDWKDL
jgi:hypothetical protein